MIIACIVAGGYGIIHDQLTYSIAPEYYTKFKFFQFELVEEGMNVDVSNPRLYVAIVGFLATWWMGFPIGLILGIYSLHSNPKLTINLAMKAFAITILIAFVTGLLGLAVGYMSNPNGSGINPWSGEADLDHYKDFMAVGSMHNFSYIGAFPGLVAAIAYVAWKKRKLTVHHDKEF